MLPLCSVGSVLFFLAPYIIPHYMAVEATLAEKSSYFVIASIPSLWVLAAVRVVQKYLQAQNIMAPSMVCGVIGVVTVFVANLIFIYAADGGYIGCAFGMLLSRLVNLVSLLYYVGKHPSTDVSVHVWLVAVGAWDIVKGTPPSHPMFREQIRKADLDRDEDAEDAPLMELTDMQVCE